jgi:ATP phosphoribosyltransferase
MALRRISAEHAARTRREVRAAASDAARPAVEEAARLAGAAPLAGQAGGLVWLVPADRAAALADALAAAGAETASVGRVDYAFGADSPLVAALDAAIGDRSA